MAISASGKKRIFTVSVCAVILIALVVGAAFLVHEAGHDCTGEGCRICAVMHVIEDNLRSFELGALALLCAVILASASFCRVLPRLLSDAFGGTLVGKSIRLNI
ncbi:MAG: hypothetical protein IJ072_02865 [Oscillospiraceae bacterium]|nr:hypothetical protein [Oscillospiraceae bacterium]